MKKLKVNEQMDRGLSGLKCITNEMNFHHFIERTGMKTKLIFRISLIFFSMF